MANKKSLTQYRRNQTQVRSFSGVIAHTADFAPKEPSLEEQADKLRKSLHKVSQRLDKKEKRRRVSTLHPNEAAELDVQILRLKQVWAQKMYNLEHLNSVHVKRNRKWSPNKSRAHKSTKS